MAKPLAVIIGAGDGLSASLARELAVDHDLTLLARSGEKMRDVAKETGARTVIADATDESAIAAVFDDLQERTGVLNAFNRSFRPDSESIAAADVAKCGDVEIVVTEMTGRRELGRSVTCWRYRYT